MTSRASSDPPSTDRTSQECDAERLERLFVYGSLQPGGPNAHLLGDLDGHWQPASVCGRLVAKGWGAGLGYPGIVLDEQGEKVEGSVFVSAALNHFWPVLDEFEGTQYRRVSTWVTLSTGVRVKAFVYSLAA